MKSILKYFLLPVTIVVTFLLAYYTPYVAVIGAVKLFSLSWLVLIFFGTILFGIIYFLIISLPNLIRIGISRLYQQTPFVIILHGIAGIIGTIWIISFFINQPPMLVEGEREYFFIKWMWQHAPLKTLFILLGLIPFSFMMVYNSAIMPFVMFSDMQNDIRTDKDVEVLDQRVEISEVSDYGTEQTIDVDDYPNDKLEPLEVQPTNNTPYVLFQPDGDLLIQGRSIPEDGSLFFDSLYEWISDYKNEPADETTLTVFYEYCNEITPKLLLRILRDLQTNCPNFIVKWKFEEEDEDMFELGEMLRRVSGCTFEFIEVF